MRAALLYSLSAYEIHLAEQTLRFMSTFAVYQIIPCSQLFMMIRHVIDNCICPV